MITALQRNTVRYEFADGVRDFQNALWLLMMGFGVWVVADFTSVWLPFARSQTVSFVFLTVAIPIGVMQGSLVLMNEYLRRRWLWRETGFIKPKSWLVPRHVLFTAYGIILGVTLVGMWAAFQLNEAWLIVRSVFIATGFGMAYIQYTIGRRLHFTRYKLVAAVGAVGTPLIALLPLTTGLAALLLSLFWAGLFIVSGLYGLRQVSHQQNESADAA